MGLGFERFRTVSNKINSALSSSAMDLNSEQSDRFRRMRKNWDFYEGYHWEEMDDVDGVQMTINYIQAFVNKYVSFELGDGVTFNVHKKMSQVKVDENNTLFEYLKSVWEDNGGKLLTVEIGQMKSVTSEAWVQVNFAEPGEFEDPFGEYPKGKMELLLLPTSAVFPEYNPHRRGELDRVLIVYSYNKTVVNPVTGGSSLKKVTYKQTWTKDKVTVLDDGVPEEYPNNLGVIPIVPIKNLILAGRNDSRSDIEDLIPMNTELNMKTGDVSEVIDYHAAPTTLVYGAKIGNLEKGANKVWGGLPKDAKVENLGMETDLGASSNFIGSLKKAMCEVGNMPESALGGAQNISNTSGVALQYANLPLIEKTKLKSVSTIKGLKDLNKMILFVSVKSGLIEIPAGVTGKEFYYTEPNIPNTLPKDTLLLLQEIQIKMKCGLMSRKDALLELGTEDVDQKIEEIDKDRSEHPDIYDTLGGGKMNSGMTNGQTPNEETAKATGGLHTGNPNDPSYL